MNNLITTSIKQYPGADEERSTNTPLLAWLAVVGLLDASYLTWNHFAGTYLSCSASSGCDEVLASEFSAIGPLPLALLGVVYYATVVVLASARAKFPGVKPALLVLTLSGLCVSALLVWLQARVLEAFCEYCMLSAFICLLTFIASWNRVPGD